MSFNVQIGSTFDRAHLRPQAFPQSSQTCVAFQTQKTMAAAFRLAWLLVLVTVVTPIAAIRDVGTEASDLVDALENRENRDFSGPPVDLDGTVAKKGWECGKPEKDVPNRELVKNAKTKAQYLIYKWLKKEVCPEQRSKFWRAMRPWDEGKKQRGELCQSTITGALAIEAWQSRCHGGATVVPRLFGSTGFSKVQQLGPVLHTEVWKKGNALSSRQIKVWKGEAGLVTKCQ